ncbi:hypothetical protein KPL70_013734 [Citrus sinensis]|nr:hypothetical protein KPL70_013734 [Citrus sinensis]
MGTKINLEKFTGQNDFNMWKIKIEALLITQGLGNAIEPDFKKEGQEGSSSTTPEQAAEIDKNARSTIILSLWDSVIREVAKERTVAGLWTKLENLYMTKSLANRLYIKKKMFSLRMIKGSSLDEHIDEFNKVCNALETIDEGLSDESKALLLISSLPKSYEHFVDALLYGGQSLSLEEVKSALGTKKLKDKQEKTDSESGEGLMARGKPKKREGKRKKQGRSKSKQKQLKCFHCHKEGHFKRDCPERKSKIKDSKDKVGNASIATDESSYETAEVLIASKEKIQGEWVLDSRCTFHMCPNRNYFTSYQSCDGGMILMGNNFICKVVGIGTVSLKMFDGVVREITQVRHVPDLKRNLISVGMLDQMGCIVKAEKGVLRVIKGSMVIMKGNKNNGLYVMNGQTVIGEASVTESGVDKTKLWHLRLGHISEKGLKELEKKGAFGKDQLNSLGLCEDCILGKASKIKFESAIHTTKEKLGYIHSDLWGPAQVTSLGGCKFFLTFIDDFSRMVWVYALKTKDEVLEKFKRWKVLVENQTNLKVKVLRTDNELEYCNKLFEDYCEKNGILRHKTVTYTPQQNGLAKRMNRTLMEKVRCLLIHSKLPKALWAETLNTACYLGKLEARALKCRFLGYPEGVKGYRLWCTDFKPPKCIISRDVTFNDAEMLNKRRSSALKEKNPETEDDKIQFEVEHAEDKKSQTPTTEESGEVDDGSYDEEGSESTESGGNTYQLARDRKKRTIRPPKRYAVVDLIAYALSAAHEINDDEPKTYQEAITSKNSLEWKRAMDEEVESLMKNETWKLIRKPEKKKDVNCKWIYKIKEGIPGAEPRRFKARLVARGFTQREGIDFTEVFSPVVRHASIRVILALVAVQDMHLEQMDVKTAFLHGELQEEIVMDQPEGEISERRRIYLLLYVDDILIACHDKAEIDQLKRLLSSEFEMKDIGHAKKILGVEIIRNRKAGTMFLTQKDYIEKVLVRFGMNESKPVQTPLASHFKLSAAMCPQTAAEQQEMSEVPYSNAVGSLMYAMVLTRPDISHALSVVSRGTTEYGLLYGGTGNKGNILVGYVDSDFAGDLNKRRSLPGYLFTLGGCTVNWKATLQNLVALSTTEAEYIAAAEALKEAIWLKGMVTELGAEQDSVEVYCDSRSAIHLSKNQTHHEKTKHIDVKLHFLRLEVSRGAVKLLKINTEENPTDMLTKAVPSAKFNLCMNLAGICGN